MNERRIAVRDMAGELFLKHYEANPEVIADYRGHIEHTTMLAKDCWRAAGIFIELEPQEPTKSSDGSGAPFDEE